MSLMCLKSQCSSKCLSVRAAWTSHTGSKRQVLEGASPVKDYVRKGQDITLPYSVNQSCHNVLPASRRRRNMFCCSRGRSKTTLRQETLLQPSWHMPSTRVLFLEIIRSVCRLHKGEHGLLCNKKSWPEPRELSGHNLIGVLINGVPFC